MKTAVSIPDELFRHADELARRLGKSRSQVYQEALSEYVMNREPEAVTRALDAAAAEVGSDMDPWLVEAGRRILKDSEW